MVGVHTPEFTVEHDIDNVRRAVRDMGIDYPVAIDNDYAVWNAFANQYWPALYIADAEGRIRHHQFGEGGYEMSERAIRQLLADAGAVDLPDDPVPVERARHRDRRRLAQRAIGGDVRRPRPGPGLRLARPRRDRRAACEYTVPARLHLNEWALAGDWTLGREDAVSNAANGRIAYRFHARDLHLILTPPAGHASARFRVLLDGQAPGDAHGLDVDEDGNGVVTEPRLYQLIRQRGDITDRLFEIELLDPGAGALCFTFG